MTRHLVLVGDSIFDNDSYVPGELGVLAQLRQSLPPGWTASKVAVDGDKIADVSGQLRNLPSDATDLIVSIGGNDALGQSQLLELVEVPSDLPLVAAEVLRRFRPSYDSMIYDVKKTGCAVVLSTIYTEIPFTDPKWRHYVPMALAHLNTAILELAEAHQLPVLRIDELCRAPEDFSAMSPIEPSAIGGQKLVDGILGLMGSP